MSKTDAIRLSIINCINRISILDANIFVQEMHMFDVEKLILNEFYKMFKLRTLTIIYSILILGNLHHVPLVHPRKKATPSCWHDVKQKRQEGVFTLTKTE